MIMDGFSAGIFRKELGSCYLACVAGRQPGLAPRPMPYADHAALQRERLTADRIDEHEARFRAAGFSRVHVWFRCLNWVSFVATP